MATPYPKKQPLCHNAPMLELSILSAFFAGLLGGGHCVGMCGGIASAAGMTTPTHRASWAYPLGYNAGRITSYGMAGALAGALGASSLLLEHLLPVERLLYLLANGMLVALGLYLAGAWQGVLLLERGGAVLWRCFQPLAGKFLPPRSVPQAYALGLVWGWLPCGLVYSVLVAALATGSAGSGALLMLAFGCGTLPTLLTLGLAAVRLRTFLQRTAVRRISGYAVLGFGVLGLAKLIQTA